MKSGLGAVLAAIAASACCLGPVAFTALGSGALAAASTKLAIVRPFSSRFPCCCSALAFIAPTALKVTGRCAPTVRVRLARIGTPPSCLWIAAIAVVLFGAFPYYSEYLF